MTISHGYGSSIDEALGAISSLSTDDTKRLAIALLDQLGMKPREQAAVATLLGLVFEDGSVLDCWACARLGAVIRNDAPEGFGRVACERCDELERESWARRASAEAFEASCDARRDEQTRRDARRAGCRVIQFLDSRVPDSFWEKVSPCPMTGCWLWIGANKGDVRQYGTVFVGGRFFVTHRFAYEQLVGPISYGLQLDHLCRVRVCCNPAHLEEVTQQENIRRGRANYRKENTHCPNGHPYSGDNLYVQIRSEKYSSRVCRACRVLHNAKYKAKRRQAIPVLRDAGGAS